VDPKALVRLNELLDKKDLELSAKIAEADEWAAKYRDLVQRLAAAPEGEDESGKVKALIEQGEFEQAGQILDRLLAKQESAADQLAQNHFNRARLFDLSGEPGAAFTHFERAYQYRPASTDYAYAYAVRLVELRRLSDAERILRSIVRTAQDASKGTASEGLAATAMDLASTFNVLGTVYWHLGKVDESRRAYGQSLQLYRVMAQIAPSFQENVAKTASNFATTYEEDEDNSRALPLLNESVDIRRKMAAKDPARRSDLAVGLRVLGDFYSRSKNDEQAEAAYGEAVRIFRAVAEGDPSVLGIGLGGTLNNLAVHYRVRGKFADAEKTFRQALLHYRDAAVKLPGRYHRGYWEALDGLARVYKQTKRNKEEEAARQDAVKVLTELSAKNPVYRAELARAFIEVGVFQKWANRLSEAERAYTKAIELYRRLVAEGADNHAELGAALRSLTSLYFFTGRWDLATDSSKEAIMLYRRVAIDARERYADDLALSLAMHAWAISEWGATEDKVTLAKGCPFLDEAEREASSQATKEMVQNAKEKYCQ